MFNIQYDNPIKAPQIFSITLDNENDLKISIRKYLGVSNPTGFVIEINNSGHDIKTDDLVKFSKALQKFIKQRID